MRTIMFIYKNKKNATIGSVFNKVKKGTYLITNFFVIEFPFWDIFIMYIPVFKLETFKLLLLNVSLITCFPRISNTVIEITSF